MVDTHISDIFFNTEHVYNRITGEYEMLRDEAEGLIDSLDGLGIPTPSVEALMNDFRERI
jgi:hypothetical protein